MTLRPGRTRPMNTSLSKRTSPPRCSHFNVTARRTDGEVIRVSQGPASAQVPACPGGLTSPHVPSPTPPGSRFVPRVPPHPIHQFRTFVPPFIDMISRAGHYGGCTTPIAEDGSTNDVLLYSGPAAPQRARCTLPRCFAGHWPAAVNCHTPGWTSRDRRSWRVVGCTPFTWRNAW